MDRFFVIAGALLGLTGVGLGAFGAHALKEHFADHGDLSAIYQTATSYHLYHALALLGAAWAAERWGGPWITWSGYLFIVGVVRLLVHRRRGCVLGQFVCAEYLQRSRLGRGHADRRRGTHGGLAEFGHWRVAGDGREVMRA